MINHLPSVGIPCPCTGVFNPLKLVYCRWRSRLYELITKIGIFGWDGPLTKQLTTTVVGYHIKVLQLQLQGYHKSSVFTFIQGSKWDGMRRYTIAALSWKGKNHTVTYFLRSIIPIFLHELYFKAKMHEIRVRSWLCPRPRWGSLQCSPRSPSWI